LKLYCQHFNHHDSFCNVSKIGILAGISLYFDWKIVSLCLALKPILLIKANWKKKIHPFPTFATLLDLNLQTTQAPKGKSNPKQAYPKCNCTSSSFEDKTISNTFT
jgi:hypothetical protein